MISRVLAAALVAGFLAACVSSLLQIAFTTPLIVAAESFEAAPAAHAHAPGEAAHQHAQDAWKPAQGFERAAFTALATLVSGVGYALLLGAVGLAIGLTPGRRNALGLAAAGFVAVSLAPALGLPPELPGMGGGPGLAARQVWWAATVLATGAGLYLLAMIRTKLAIAAGLGLLLAPHLMGAPAAPHAHSSVPPLLAAQFAARSLGVALAFWISLGLALGWAWERFGAKPKGSLAAA
jgi:cobalt transporter subunit CbtA